MLLENVYIKVEIWQKKSDPVVSLTQRDQILAIFESVFLANTKQQAKRLQPVNQGPREECLMKKPRVENLVTLSLQRYANPYIVFKIARRNAMIFFLFEERLI
jgi:hypothetical protein